MLREISHLSQYPDDYRRRGFTDGDHHLLIWYRADGGFAGFQLTYGGEYDPRVVTWLEKRGFSHTKIDYGGIVWADSAPILVPCRDFDLPGIQAAFDQASTGLPEAERAFVLGKLRDNESGAPAFAGVISPSLPPVA